MATVLIFVVLYKTYTPSGTPVQPSQTDNAVKQSNNGVIVPVQEVPHPVSLQALMEKEYNGSELTLGEVLVENEAYTRYYVTYKSGALTISGIMNIPKKGGPFPLIILNHGYIDPEVYTNGRGLKREQDYLARRGYAVLHPDYRNHADSDSDPDAELRFRLGYTEDVVNAVSAVKNSSLAEITKDRIGMLGHSMGGGIALNVMVAQPDLIKAFVLFAPVSADVKDNFEKWTSRRPELAQQLIATYGSFETAPEFWHNLSPLNFLDRVTAPVEIHHGTADESVPLEWSEKLERAFEAQNKDAKLFTYPREPHEFINAWPLVMERTVVFFDRALKGNRAANTEKTQDRFVPPIDNWESRVTKKPFGIYITPDNSPVSPERFAGYHTGTDFETLPDEQGKGVLIYAICNGPLVAKRTASGYGGIAVQQCVFQGETVSVVYGHVRLSSVTINVNETLRAGDTLGVLGKGYSSETDGERKHLHLGIYKGEGISILGYVQNSEELGGWIDATKYF